MSPKAVVISGLSWGGAVPKLTHADLSTAWQLAPPGEGPTKEGTQEEVFLSLSLGSDIPLPLPYSPH